MLAFFLWQRKPTEHIRFINVHGQNFNQKINFCRHVVTFRFYDESCTSILERVNVIPEKFLEIKFKNWKEGEKKWTERTAKYNKIRLLCVCVHLCWGHNRKFYYRKSLCRMHITLIMASENFPTFNRKHCVLLCIKVLIRYGTHLVQAPRHYGNIHFVGFYCCCVVFFFLLFLILQICNRQNARAVSYTQFTRMDGTYIKYTCTYRIGTK